MCKSYGKIAPESVGLIEYVYSLSVEFDTAGRHGSACGYRSLAASLRGYGAEFVPGEPFVTGYAAFLASRRVCRNTSSYYMRLLRTALKRAHAHGLLGADPSPWFRSVYTGFDRTRKRAIALGCMRRIAAVELQPESHLALARDIFMFSFYARGMAFVDAIMLTRDNLHGDYIVYRRRKTGREMRIELLDKMRSILDRYARTGSSYLLPVLSETDCRGIYRQYRSAIGRYNMLLKKLAAVACVPDTLSSYTARHSWATIARDSDVPIRIISEGMGHESELTTRIYLASIADKEIDLANRRLAALV